MRNLYLTLSFILCLLTGLTAQAQDNQFISGIVKDQKGETLPGATIFLTNTQYKTVTGNSGKFSISDIAPGSYQLVVKMMGFMPYVSQVAVNGKLQPLIISLKEDNILLNTVTIKSTDLNRGKYLKQFIKYFIGESTNAGQCKILNPQVLSFHYDKNTEVLQASADTILRIQNSGLGYILNYVLTEFKLDPKNNVFAYTGYPFFEAMKGSAAQQKRWDNKRKDAYLGSVNHFFRSVYNNNTTEAGFAIYEHPAKMAIGAKMSRLPIDDVFLPTDSNFKVLNPLYGSSVSSKDLYVVYNRDKQPRDFTFSSLDLYPSVDLWPDGQLSGLKPLVDNVLIDRNGSLTPPKSFFVSGYWAWQKMAELLPLGYHVDVTGVPVTKTDKPQAANITEKAYLHLDKSYYTVGDTLWFKAYVVAGAKHQLSTVSNVLNVELIDSKDSVKQRIRLLLQNGVSKGDFSLPFTLESGTYHIRAYTSWMRNAGEDYFFDQAINVINPNPAFVSAAKAVSKPNNAKKVPGKSALPLKPDVDVQFFPEGGSFAVDVPEKIAFKATGAGGRGVNITGIITDEQDNPVTMLAGSHLGMGTFFITAKEGETYKAKIKLPDSTVRIVPLPQAVNRGYVLSVTTAGPDNIRVAAQAVSTKDTASQSDEMTLIGCVGGVVYYEGKSKAGSNSFIATIPKSKFPMGIVQFTLFSSAGEPLNERLLFVQNNDQLKIDVATEKQTYAPQQKVKLNLTAKTNDDQPVQGSFSVSVIDENKLPSDVNANNILSNLLLTSDLKGYVENPGYYFALADQQTADDLDALMLTQGYRKFVWKKDSTDTYQPESGLAISGYLKNLRNRPLGNAKVMLLATGPTVFNLDTAADKTGHFTFNNLFFTDSTKFMLEGVNERERYDLQISLDKPIWPKTAYSTAIDMMANMDSLKKSSLFMEAVREKFGMQEKYRINDKAKMLKEVTIRDIGPPELKYSDNINGPGRADQVFTSKDIASFKCGFITTCLEGRIQGIALNNGGANSYFYLTKLHIPGVPPPPMLILIDGSLADVGQLNALPPNSIASIEVLRSLGMTAAYGGKGSAGILVITLKRGADIVDVRAPSPGTITFRTGGFYKARDFYSPQYDDPKTNKEIADLRTTIYWNPMLQTDKDGNASFEYFNAGSKGNYKVVVEGIDNDGNIGRYVYRYRVE